MRSKSLQVAGAEAHQRNQSLGRQLDEYRTARYAGLQPKSVFKKDVDAAWRATDATGTAYRADV